MFKLNKLVIALLFSFSCLVGCESENEKMYNTQLLTDITGKIESQLKEVADLDYLIGYNAKGNVVLWVEIDSIYKGRWEDYIHTWVKITPEIQPIYHQAYLAKTLFDGMKEIELLWLNTDKDRQIKCSLAKYPDYRRKNISQTEISEQLIDNKTILTVLESSWVSSHYEKRIVIDSPFLRNRYKELFGKRLKKYDVFNPEWSWGIQAKIEEYPPQNGGNGINFLKMEIAKAFAASVGRYENQRSQNVTDCRLTYMDKTGKAILDVLMTSEGYKEWKKDGLDYRKWYLYCEEMRVHDRNLRLNDYEETVQKNEVKKTKKHEYNQLMTNLKSIEGIEVLLLGEGKKGMAAVLKVENGPEKQVYQRQMEITKDLMSKDFQSVWFFREVGEQLEMIFIDQERYKVLMYLNDTNEYDFTPEYWPEMAKNYWLADKFKVEE